MTHNTLEQAQELGAQIIARRGWTKVWFDVRPLETNDANLAQQLNRYVGTLGLHAAPDDWWLPLSLADAHQWLAHLLHHDMAYYTEVMPLAEAELLATQFLALFAAGAMCYTVYEHAGYIVSSTTFGDGLIVWDDTHIGLVWIGDED